MWERSGRLLLSLALVSLLACSCAWAIPGRAEKKVATPIEIVAAQAVIPSETTVLPGLSAPKSDETLIALSTRLNSLENARKLDKNEIAEIHDELVNIKEEYLIVVQDAEAKEEKIAELQEENSRQADAIVKATSSKFFANVSGIMGFDSDRNPIYGAGANIGRRFGDGMTISLGGQYMFADKDLHMDLDPHITNFTAVLSIGWEW